MIHAAGTEGHATDAQAEIPGRGQLRTVAAELAAVSIPPVLDTVDCLAKGIRARLKVILRLRARRGAARTLGRRGLRGR